MNHLAGVSHSYIDSLWMPFTQMAEFEAHEPLIIEGGQGCWVTDTEGNRLLDLMSGMWVTAIGYGRTEIADAVFKAMHGTTFNPWGTTSRATIELSTRIANLAPDTASRIFLTSGGSEANETAIKMAKRYHANRGDSKRYKIISRRGSYHGATQAVMALGGGGVGVPWEYGPRMPGNVYVPQPARAKCGFCRDRRECNLECAKEVERIILYEGPETIAALIGEPISVSSGVVPPHAEYWPTLRQTCDKYGILMIMDEVITGFGRSGRWFASEHWDFKPDITTVAKGMSSGYLPIGGTIASKAVADEFLGGQREKFKHLLTFSGHPICCAASLANIEIIEREDLVAHSFVMGEYLFQKLHDLKTHRIVGDIRGGFGLMCGVDLIADKTTKAKFPLESGVADRLNSIMIKHGLLTRVSDVIPILPPLIITRDEIDHAVTKLSASLSELENQI